MPCAGSRRRIHCLPSPNNGSANGRQTLCPYLAMPNPDLAPIEDVIGVVAHPPGRILGSYRLGSLQNYDRGILIYGVEGEAAPFPMLAYEVFPVGAWREPSGPLRMLSGHEALLRAAEERMHTLKELSDPGLPRVQALLEEPDGTCFLLVEAPEGRTLSELLAQRGPLPSSAVAQLAIKLSSALRTLHRAGLVHGAISPDHLYFTADRRVLLAGPPPLMPSGGWVGASDRPSLAIVPPELELRGKANGIACDVFGFGATLFQALTGQPPERGVDGQLSGWPAGTPPSLQEMLERALLVDPTLRAADVTVLAQILRGPKAAQTAPLQAAPALPPEGASVGANPKRRKRRKPETAPDRLSRWRKHLKRQRVRHALIAVTLVALLGTGVTIYIITPKLSDVSYAVEHRDSKALWRLIDQHARSARHHAVVQAAIQGLSDLNQAPYPERLGQLLVDQPVTELYRNDLLGGFVRNRRLVPNLEALLSGGGLDAATRHALIEATNQVDPSAFTRLVDAEIGGAREQWERDPQAAIARLEAARPLDANGERQAALDEALFLANLAHLRRESLPGGESTVRSILQRLAAFQEASPLTKRAKPALQAIATELEAAARFRNEANDAERGVAEAREEADLKQGEAERLRLKLQGVSSIRAFLIDRLNGEPNVFEISFNLFSSRDRAILRTVRTDFSTKGWFSMYVRKAGTQRLYTTDGYPTEWPVLEEEPEASLWAMALMTADTSEREARERYESLRREQESSESKARQSMEQAGVLIRSMDSGGILSGGDLPSSATTEPTVPDPVDESAV